MSDNPLRVLHVVGGMNRGGVETWLMHVLRRLDRQSVAMDFLVHVNHTCAFDAEIRALGAKILRCPYTRAPVRYARCLRRHLVESGPYDVVHSHVHHFSGWVLRAARSEHVPTRIAHSHSDTRPYQASARALRKVYFSAMRHLLRRHASIGLSCSEEAQQALFEPGGLGNGQLTVLKCGIPLEPYSPPVEQRRSVRSSLGIPEEAVVVGHVGRFVHQKNHPFLLQLFRHLKHRVPEAHLLLVGGGELEGSMRDLAVQIGIEQSVTFAGVRSDVDTLMMQAMDAFVLPSHVEGLSLVVMEAQAAGLPCVVSDRMPTEASVAPGLVQRLSLESPESAWVDALEQALQRSATIDREAALSAVRRSPFNIDTSVAHLLSVYGVS